MCSDRPPQRQGGSVNRAYQKRESAGYFKEPRRVELRRSPSLAGACNEGHFGAWHKRRYNNLGSLARPRRRA